MSALNQGDSPSPESQPVRTSYPHLAPPALENLIASALIPQDEVYPDPGEGPPLISAALDPARWPAWTDADRWTIPAEDLDETDPALPLFALKAHQPGGN